MTQSGSENGGTGEVPVRSMTQSKAGIVSILLFQVIILIFCLLQLAANFWPMLLAQTPELAQYRAIRWGVYASLPVAAAMLILSIMGLMQETKRRNFAAVGLLLSGVFLLICLVYLRR